MNVGRSQEKGEDAAGPLERLVLDLFDHSNRCKVIIGNNKAYPQLPRQWSDGDGSAVVRSGK
jgi:hypothetical protein